MLAMKSRKDLSARAMYVSVVCVSVAVYLNSLTGELVHDDIVALARNQDVLGGTSIRSLLLNDFWGTPLADPGSHKSYRPLTTLTFRLTTHFFGLDPTHLHSCNILLHALSCLLFTRLSVAVAGLSRQFSAVAGILFAVHPIHSDAVASIVGRADVLACSLFLMSFLLYHDSGLKSHGRNRLALSVLFAVLSMLAKETGITVLMVNLLYDFYKHFPAVRRSVCDMRWNEDAYGIANRTARTLVALSVLLTFRLAMLQGSLPKFSIVDNPAAFHPVFLFRLLTFSYLAVFNFGLLLCPSTLSHDWQMGSIPLVTNMADSRNLATCAFFGCALLLLYRCVADMENQRQNPMVLGLLLLVIPFLPASNLVVTVGFVVAERVLYIPSLGFILLVTHGLQLLHQGGHLRRKSLKTLILLLVVTQAVKTVQRNRDWACRESLARAGLRILPGNAKMHYNFANFLHSQNQTDSAIFHYRRALSLWPHYASAHNNLGTLLAFPEAEFHFKEAIKILPTHVNAHYNLGTIYSKMNRTGEARRMAERSIQLDAQYVPSYLLLARLSSPARRNRLLYHVTKLVQGPAYLAFYADYLLMNRRFLQAVDFYSKALEFDPGHVISRLGVSKSLRAMGQKSRLHQLLIRWHIRCCKGRLVYSGDLYLAGLRVHYSSSPSPLPHAGRSLEPHFNCNRNDHSKDLLSREQASLCFHQSTVENYQSNRHSYQSHNVYSGTPDIATRPVLCNGK